MEKELSLVRKEEEEDDNRNEKSAEERSYLSMEMMKKVSSMAAPMVAVSVSQYLLQVISMVMAGHLGKLSLSGVAIATSVTNVTGFSVLFGLAGALDTLCGQAFGAKQYRKLGAYTYTSMLCLLLFCLPISLLWIFMDKILELFHQDPQISQLACRYSIWLIPALFAYAVLQSLIRYFQSQRLVLPLFLSAFGALCFHIPFCWLLFYKLRLGIIGAALSIGVSYWLNVLLLWIFMRYSVLHGEMRNIRLQEIFSNFKQFISLAIPSAMMTCLVWWSFEIFLLMTGLLPNSKLETSVMSICLNIWGANYCLVIALGATASTHVSNQLGAGNPWGARAAANSVFFMGGVVAIITSVSLFSFRRTWAYIYSNEREVTHYATEITPFLCLSIIVSSFVCMVLGVARGTGWQRIGAYTSLGSYYMVGIPLGAILCFVMKLRAKGLWIGILVASTLNLFVFALVTIFTNWEQEATKARDRVSEITTPQVKANQETEKLSKEDAQVSLNDISETV